VTRKKTPAGVARTYHFDAPEVRDADRELHVQAGMMGMIFTDFPLAKTAAVPNGMAGRAPSARTRAEGFADGFPDFLVMEPFTPLHRPAIIAIVEVKAKTDTDEEQHKWLTWLQEAGFRTGVFRSAATLKEAMIGWGFTPRHLVPASALMAVR
jgi:hypothetical protein